MLKYTTKRLLQSVVTIFVVVSLAFLLLRLMPISSYFDDTSWTKMSWEAKTAVLVKIGICDTDGNVISPFVQLLNFYKSLFTSFDFGTSIKLQEGRSAFEIVKDKIPYSVGFGVFATVFQLLIGYTFGVLMAKYKGRFVDLLGNIYIVLLSGVPATISCLLLHIYITKWAKWPMLFKQTDIRTWFAPILILIFVYMVGQMIWMRRFTVDQLNSDYVKLAEAKGLPSRKVMFGHVLRNSIVPLSYNLPAAFISTISGSLIVENLVAIPGMGGLLTKAAVQHDNNVVQLIVFIYVIIGIISVLLGDLLVAFVDPRIRFVSREGVR